MPELAPEGWTQEVFLPQVPYTDISVYEVHIRDFSASDETVPEHLRGKYIAFALVCSPCMASDPWMDVHSFVIDHYVGAIH